MNTSPIASRMAVESTRRAMTVPARDSQPRRALALALQTVAHRLDPHVTASPRITFGR